MEEMILFSEGICFTGIITLFCLVSIYPDRFIITQPRTNDQYQYSFLKVHRQHLNKSFKILVKWIFKTPSVISNKAFSLLVCKWMHTILMQSTIFLEKKAAFKNREQKRKFRKLPLHICRLPQLKQIQGMFCRIIGPLLQR